MSLNIMDTMAADEKRARRNHSPELKAKILAECAAVGTSVAGRVRISVCEGAVATIEVHHPWHTVCVVAVPAE